MARSVKELEAWAALLELCGDDCQVFDTTPAMRSAILEVEQELHRLHKIEDCAVRLCRLLEHANATSTDDAKWDEAMDYLWHGEEKVREMVKTLLPDAFTPDALECDWQELKTGTEISLGDVKRRVA